MAYGNLVFDSTTGHLNYDSATGHLVFRNWVDIASAGRWRKYGYNSMSDPSDYPSMMSVYPGALADLQADAWDASSYGYIDTLSDWAQYHPTGEPYYTFVWLYAGCMRFNTAAYKGKTLYKIRVSCAYYHKYTACDFRLTYQTDAGTVPDDSWAWTTADPYVNVPGSGSSTLTLGTPLVLDDTLWLTSWISDYTPPTNALQDNYFRIDSSPVRMYFQD
jgi:hypothetical protein